MIIVSLRLFLFFSLICVTSFWINMTINSLLSRFQQTSRMCFRTELTILWDLMLIMAVRVSPFSLSWGRMCLNFRVFEWFNNVHLFINCDRFRLWSIHINHIEDYTAAQPSICSFFSLFHDHICFWVFANAAMNLPSFHPVLREFVIIVLSDYMSMKWLKVHS